MVSVAVLGLNRFGEEIYNYLTSHDSTDVLGIFTEKSQFSVIDRIEPDYLISAGFDHIIPDDVLDSATEGAINLHPSYLPYNRGVNPDIWSILREEKAGVSIHYLTSEMDAGPIISQTEVRISPDDTARTLRERLDEEMVSLFKSTWDDIYSGKIDAVKQNSSDATYNYSRDFERVCEIDLEKEQTATQFIDRLRALTFPPYYNAYFEKDGERYYVRISITPEDEIDSDDPTWDTPTLF